MRKLGTFVVALSLLAPSAFAAETSAPLAPGKPAGVQKAQTLHPIAMWIAGFGIIAGGVLLVTSANNNNAIITSVTSSTGP